jgi:hypothetical protein
MSPSRPDDDGAGGRVRFLSSWRSASISRIGRPSKDLAAGLVWYAAMSPCAGQAVGEQKAVCKYQERERERFKEGIAIDKNAVRRKDSNSAAHYTANREIQHAPRTTRS